MEALNIAAEYRRNKDVTGAEYLSIEDFTHNKVTSGQWVEDDGEYYTREEWDSQYAQQESMPYPEEHYVGNYPSTPIKEADPRYVPGVSEVDDDMTDAEWTQAFGKGN